MIVKLKHSEYGEITTIDNVSIYELLMVDDPKGSVTMHWITKTNDAGQIISRCGWDCDNWDLVSVTGDWDQPDQEEQVGNLPVDFYLCHRILFLIHSDRDNINAAQEFLDDVGVPYACGIHETFFGLHAHFMVDWYYLNRYSRVSLRSQLEDLYQASCFHRSDYLSADLCYMKDGCSDESDFINHLNKEEN